MIVLSPVPVVLKIEPGEESFFPRKACFRVSRKKDLPNLLGRERK